MKKTLASLFVLIAMSSASLMAQEASVQTEVDHSQAIKLSPKYKHNPFFSINFATALTSDSNEAGDLYGLVIAAGIRPVKNLEIGGGIGILVGDADFKYRDENVSSRLWNTDMSSVPLFAFCNYAIDLGPRIQFFLSVKGGLSFTSWDDPRYDRYDHHHYYYDECCYDRTKTSVGPYLAGGGGLRFKVTDYGYIFAEYELSRIWFDNPAAKYAGVNKTANPAFHTIKLGYIYSF